MAFRILHPSNCLTAMAAVDEPARQQMMSLRGTQDIDRMPIVRWQLETSIHVLFLIVAFVPVDILEHLRNKPQPPA